MSFYIEDTLGTLMGFGELGFTKTPGGSVKYDNPSERARFEALQGAINRYLKKWVKSSSSIKVDGILGTNTIRAYNAVAQNVRARNIVVFGKAMRPVDISDPQVLASGASAATSWINAAWAGKGITQKNFDDDAQLTKIDQTPVDEDQRAARSMSTFGKITQIATSKAVLLPAAVLLIGFGLYRRRRSF